MVIHKAIIFTKARVGFFIPKKIIDHRAFNPNWIKNNLRALDFNFDLALQTKKSDIPINK